jgi:hypothetical protein
MLSHLLSVCTDKLKQYDRLVALKTAPAVLKDIGICLHKQKKLARAHIHT